MQKSSIRVFCYVHNNSFTMGRTNEEVVCRVGGDIHVVGDSFCNEARWMYCCECEHYWMIEQGRRDYIKSCPSCGASDKRHYYSCDACGVTMMDYSKAYCRQSFRILPWGHPHPFCAGCNELQQGIPQTHHCPTLRGMLTTALSDCPFCGVGFEAAARGRMAKYADMHEALADSSRAPYRKLQPVREVYEATRNVMEVEFDLNLARVRAMLAAVENIKKDGSAYLFSLT